MKRQFAPISGVVILIGVFVSFYFGSRIIRKRLEVGASENKNGGTESSQLFGANSKDIDVVPVVPREAERYDQIVSNYWASRQKAGTWEQDPRASNALAKLRSDRKWLWKQPINFWGVVQDQDGNPVEAAEVQMSWTDLSAEGTSKASVMSDSDGRVSLTKKKGYVMTVSAKKWGYYETSKSALGLNYAEPWDLSFHEPDPRRPVILTLRKKGTPAKLIRRQGLDYLAGPDQHSFRLDLLGQRFSESDWDLEWTFEHGPELIVNERRRFDWVVTLRARGGGVLPHQDEFPFEAPETGYLTVFRKEMKADDPQWQGRFEEQCYFTSRDGQVYGRIRFGLAPFPKSGRPQLQVYEYFLNPKGERNLEFAHNLEVNERYRKPEELHDR